MQIANAPLESHTDVPRPVGQTVRVGVRIMHVPTVTLDACKCGAIYASPNDALVERARKGLDFPPMQCQCGRILVGVRKVVIG